MYFNVVLYCERDKIKMKIQRITSSHHVENEIPKPITFSLKKPFDHDFKKVKSYPFFLENEVNTYQVSNLVFKANKYGLLSGNTNWEEEYHCLTVGYDVPADFSYLSNFITIMNNFVNHYCGNVVMHKNQSIEDNLIKNDDNKYPHLNQSLLNFFNHGFNSRPSFSKEWGNKKSFIQQLLSLTNVPDSYKESLQLLKTNMEADFTNRLAEHLRME